MFASVRACMLACLLARARARACVCVCVCVCARARVLKFLSNVAYSLACTRLLLDPAFPIFTALVTTALIK